MSPRHHIFEVVVINTLFSHPLFYDSIPIKRSKHYAFFANIFRSFPALTPKSEICLLSFLIILLTLIRIVIGSGVVKTQKKTKTKELFQSSPKSR